MHKKYHITHIDKPDGSMWTAIGGGVHSFNIQQAGDDYSQPICFILQGTDQTISGGLIGEIHWNWFYINLLWVKEELRGQGYGYRLLELAESKAIECGAKHAYLDTFSFQAPDFYQRNGYEIFGTLHDFPIGHQRYYLKKEL